MEPVYKTSGQKNREIKYCWYKICHPKIGLVLTHLLIYKILAKNQGLFWISRAFILLIFKK